MVCLIMAKVLSVYLNDYDLELLNNLRQVLNIQEEGRIMKVALKHLGNDHMHQEPASDRVAPELMIEIPAEVRLRSMMLSLIDECKKEVTDQKASEEKEKKTAETAKRIVDWMRGKNA